MKGSRNTRGTKVISRLLRERLMSETKLLSLHCISQRSKDRRAAPSRNLGPGLEARLISARLARRGEDEPGAESGQDKSSRDSKLRQTTRLPVSCVSLALPLTLGTNLIRRSFVFAEDKRNINLCQSKLHETEYNNKAR